MAERTPIDPGIVARVAVGVRYMFTGQAPSWFGPLAPLPEVVREDEKPSVIGRQFDYPVGYNVNTRPRVGEAISFGQMRALADSYDLLRLVIETRKDQLCKLKWSIKPRKEGTKSDSRSEAIQDFLQAPDKEHPWEEWLRMLLEDLLVIDAATIYPRMTKGGNLYALEPVDGATIKRVISDTGRTPLPPESAYQQILKGVPAINYTRDELIYRPRNVRTHKVYGYSPVEQVIMTVNIALRRQVDQLSYYTDGNAPNLLFQVPKEWQPDQIKQFQEWWDTLTQGGSKHHGRFIPEGADPVEVKTPPLKDLYDEWLARVVCFAFSISPQPFVAQVNRSTAETAKEAEISEGLEPFKAWIKSTIDMAIVRYFGASDLEFMWAKDADIDPLIQSQIDQIYVSAKVLHPDEVRAEMGRDPLTPEQKADMNPPLPLGLDEYDSPPESAKEALSKSKKALAPINRDRPAIRKKEKALSRVINRFLAAQAAVIAEQIAVQLGLEKSSQIGQERARHIVESITIDWSELPSQTEDLLATIATMGGELALDQLDLMDDDITRLMGEKAAAWAHDRSAEMVGMKWVGDVLVPNPDAKWQITEGTRDMIRSTVEQAIDDGWSAQELAKALQESRAFGKARALMIARTETAKATMAGAMRGYEESGLVAGKRWLTAQDDLVSPECRKCGAIGVIGLNDTFPSGEKEPPNHPHCRCDIVPVLDDEVPVLLGGKEAVLKTFKPSQPRGKDGRWVGSGGLRLNSKVFHEFASGKGEGREPVARIDKTTANVLGTHASVVHLSSETVAKQLREHPDVKPSDYKRVQSMLDHGEMRRDKEHHIGLLHDQHGRTWYAVLKTTQSGKAVFLQSLRRTKGSDISRIRSRSELIRPEKIER